jgi:hypothetical protein
MRAPSALIVLRFDLYERLTLDIRRGLLMPWAPNVTTGSAASLVPRSKE